MLMNHFYSVADHNFQTIAVPTPICLSCKRGQNIQRSTLIPLGSEKKVGTSQWQNVCLACIHGDRANSEMVRTEHGSRGGRIPSSRWLHARQTQQRFSLTEGVCSCHTAIWQECICRWMITWIPVYLKTNTWEGKWAGQISGSFRWQPPARLLLQSSPDKWRASAFTSTSSVFPFFLSPLHSSAPKLSALYIWHTFYTIF